MARHRVPAERPGPPLPPEPWDTALLPYGAFLATHASASFRLEFWGTLRDGNRVGLALPGLVALAPAVRWMLRGHLRHPASELALRDGVQVLMLYVAYVEFWAHEGPSWGLRYLWDRRRWDEWAKGRAQQLVDLWLAWRAKARERRP